ncbi:MAG: DoxX family protein [Myxococcaceae bacterium]|nr:DoxX family protein [Myxococcaceae bacterium]
MATAEAPARSKGLHIALWVVQVLLGLMFAFAGATKAFSPFESLADRMPWTVAVGVGMTRFIGLSELLGGIGLIVPAATRIMPKLTAAAGAGLALVMVLAAGFHVMRGEFAALPINLVLAGLAAFVAWGRATKAPITPRG